MSTPWRPPDPDPSGSQQPQPWQSPQQSEPQWVQPPFAPGYQEPADSSPYSWPPTQPPRLPAVTGAVFTPGAKVPPPSPLESILRVLAGVIWPAMILLVIFGNGGLFGAIIFAIIVSAFLRRVTGELRRRRIQSATVVPPPPPGATGPDLR